MQPIRNMCVLWAMLKKQINQHFIHSVVIFFVILVWFYLPLLLHNHAVEKLAATIFKKMHKEPPAQWDFVTTEIVDRTRTAKVRQFALLLIIPHSGPTLNGGKVVGNIVGKPRVYFTVQRFSRGALVYEGCQLLTNTPFAAEIHCCVNFDLKLTNQYRVLFRRQPIENPGKKRSKQRSLELQYLQAITYDMLHE